ncbi:MAG: glycosyltransferase family A protein [Planctomycetota bacterium]
MATVDTPQAAGPAVDARAAGRILVVTPCRNEEPYMRRTLDAVAHQTCLPAQWVIVDDGSTDGTPAILAEYANRLPWLRIVRRDDRGERSVGPGVIEAFYAGLHGIELAQFEFVCKLDLDLDLPRDYFERLIARMRQDPRLGSCSGKPFYRDAAGHERLEWCDDEIVVGMTKFYRVACFQEIGGFVRAVMWDGIDSHRCRMFGWIARSTAAPELRFEHLRQMGSSDAGVLRGRRRHGAGQYFMGTTPVYLLASAVRRLFQPPCVLGALAMLSGFVAAWWRRAPRYEDREFRAFLRHFQWGALLRGKARTIARIERATAARWQARHGPRTPR